MLLNVDADSVFFSCEQSVGERNRACGVVETLH